MAGDTSIELIREKEKFEAFFEFASIGILVANAEGIIDTVNAYLLSQFGYDRKEELIGKPVEILIPKRYDSVHINHRKKYIDKPMRRPMGVGRDLFGRKKDGTEFNVEVSLSNFSSIHGVVVIAFVIDITKRKETENAIILQKEELAEKNLKIGELNEDLEKKVARRTAQLQQLMQQVEASRDELEKALRKEKAVGDMKTRFVSMASHEFRTPLSTILSSASLLSKYTESDEQEKRDKHISRIKSSVHNLTDILNEFLSIGRIEDGKIVTRYSFFDVKNFISNLLSEIKITAKEGQQFIYSHEGNEMIELDENLLRNIIFNLLSNAIKFTGSNGIIQIDSKVSDAGFVIVITDNGMGISEEDQVHLFERFFRASNATNIQGTGLGLHIVSKYVELMNGVIEYKSELEKGSTFTICFNNKIKNEIQNFTD